MYSYFLLKNPTELLDHGELVLVNLPAGDVCNTVSPENEVSANLQWVS